MLLLRAILEEKPFPVKDLVVAGGNMALIFSNSKFIKKALKMIELLVIA